MNFTELEKLMRTKGINSLAEIARALDTTPQAVSNWKARNQVPHHVVNKVLSEHDSNINKQAEVLSAQPYFVDKGNFSLADILLIVAQQLKIITLITFISAFMTFTYVQFIQTPEYISSATILLPQSNPSGNFSGLSGIASQFGVNLGSGSNQIDLSSPSLYPELLKSRTFAEKILEKKFYTDFHKKKLSLLQILNFDKEGKMTRKDELITKTLSTLSEMLNYKKDPISNFSIIEVTASEPVFSKELADEVLIELESLNRFFKSKTVNEKTKFIQDRIFSVKADLEASENKLQKFNEQNRQISSPALLLEQERFERDVEIQKGIFLTLKQQLELAKIEEVQEVNVVKVLDYPEVPLYRSNKNLKVKFVLSVIMGVGLGVFFGFVRSYINNNDINERRKIRKIKGFIKKKSKDVLFDYRITSISSFLFVIFTPYYIKYYTIFSPILIVYLIAMTMSIVLFLTSVIKNKINLNKENHNAY